MINISEKLKKTFLMIGFLAAFLLIILGLYFNLRDTKQKQVLPDEILTAQVEDIQDEPIEDYWDLYNDFEESNKDSKSSVQTELIVEYDYSQVPVNINGLHLANNNDWLTYYASCKNADAYVCDFTMNESTNLNFINVGGRLLRLPFHLDDLPDDVKHFPESHYFIYDKTQHFEGENYYKFENGNYNFYNGMHIQVYPTSDIVNAVGVVKDISNGNSKELISIAGITTNMKEEDVIKKYGYGFVSNKDFSNDLIKERNLPITVFQSRIYKNGSGILVVTFDENRKVNSVFLYTINLHRDSTTYTETPVS